MKTTILILAIVCAGVRAGERFNLAAECPVNGIGYAPETITLARGESAELKFCSYAGDDFERCSMEVTVNGKAYSFDTSYQQSGVSFRPVRPMMIAGPAEVKFRVGTEGENGPALKEFAVVEVDRIGTASGPVPIPQEAGTTWQVILEASSDLVNWTAVQPGDYPSSTPQRYFRTRLVKRP